MEKVINVKSKSGVLVLEIRLAKSASHDRGLRITLSWDDMLSLPLGGDILRIGRAELEIITTPASDEVLLDAPETVPEGAVWECRYDNTEWMSYVALTRLLRADPKVLTMIVVPRDAG